ncbi:hypothetical protein Lser_V15G22163 [Lactuca serriola]
MTFFHFHHRFSLSCSAYRNKKRVRVCVANSDTSPESKSRASRDPDIEGGEGGSLKNNDRTINSGFDWINGDKTQSWKFIAGRSESQSFVVSATEKVIDGSSSTKQLEALDADSEHSKINLDEEQLDEINEKDFVASPILVEDIATMEEVVLKDDSLSSSNDVSSNKSRISHISKSREISASPKAPETSSRHASYATKPVKVDDDSHRDRATVSSPKLTETCRIRSGSKTSKSKVVDQISIFDIVVGDVITLKIGDQVPADGVLISGHSLSVDESSMIGESKIVHKDHKSPILMSGCKVADGAINIFTIAVTIVVVAVLGLPLAVTLTLAYSMRKMMSDIALGLMKANSSRVRSGKESSSRKR